MQEKKHPCPDCQFCQWCSDTRCGACLGHGRSCRKKLSIAEQIELYEKVNREFAEKKAREALTSPPCRCKK
jgi:hypothetical protein